ncbi:MAG: Gfo/Idh/MocA family oxidoreductase [Moorea sp. SIO4G2]|uniref:Oxidoreductase n=2 Tax=Moorena TaxID=1155738 RepID=A0A1U7N567_9CYAN|nr:Gfo/Idh/MocA family oxidoreductase [Moorena bouillonii]NEO49794.1 Gfo/Idh/MocA family oxidoreductase [Moorena sp. SIO4A3]NEO63165.1 Gfo/Idh/MocA family oxidoreductase [Moorena sp. SIO4G2]NEQ81483.1 Gfo/Idh/MocA family oxidoreductase [Moorena sp. SIO2I5]OLT61088.1 oxidoreductase [Moorena bouillonii PNG]
MGTDILVIGTGEYVTGFVHGAAANSDKSAGVVALGLFDLRSRGKVEQISLCGRDGKRFPGIRHHFAEQISSRYQGIDASVHTFPDDNDYNPQAYQTAIEKMKPGSGVIVVTPDDTHFEIAMTAIRQGMHVLVAKPLVKTLAEHQKLIEAGKQHNVLVGIEMHKRFDPMYSDARDRARSYGDFSYMSSYMSQPRSQLNTFGQWAGRSSDISYYLNSHHIDLLDWMIGDRARPIQVNALAATGVAKTELGIDTEDTITLTVQWENIESRNLGISIHTASWIAPKSDVHSQQRFFYMGHQGELQVDQAHRGYTTATVSGGYASINPLFMKYEPSDGKFAGQGAYGYQSLERFVDAVGSINEGKAEPKDFDNILATAARTLQTTAILEAGRLSLDSGGLPVEIKYSSQELLTPETLNLNLNRT